MKKRFFLVVLLVIAAAIAWWLLSPGSSSQNTPANSSSVAEPRPASDSGQAPPTVAEKANPSHPSNTVVIGGVPISEDEVRHAENVRADPLFDWKQPIDFYGKVVDENNRPVAGAEVEYDWSTLSDNGTAAKHGESDSSGLFEIHEKGKRISISASKEGYYSAGDARNATFEYANPADGLFTPDPAKPVLFHLRKKSAGADLITSQRGMSPDFSFGIPRDGSPVKLDVMQRKIGEGGQIQISENKPEHNVWQQATNWWFRMEIPDGGFVAETDEFPFEAPEDGYQPVVQFDFQQGQTNWATALKKDFYIKFGNPPRYGRFQVQTDISYGGAIITYAINADGSRNLESK